MNKTGEEGFGGIVTEIEEMSFGGIVTGSLSARIIELGKRNNG